MPSKLLVQLHVCDLRQHGVECSEEATPMLFRIRSSSLWLFPIRYADVFRAQFIYSTSRILKLIRSYTGSQYINQQMCTMLLHSPPHLGCKALEKLPGGLIFIQTIRVQVNIPAESGEMGVLANHVPSIEQLKPGLVEVIEESGGSKQFFRMYKHSSKDKSIIKAT